MQTAHELERKLESQRTSKHGDVEDVARTLIELARAKGENGIVECEYGNVTLTARSTSTVKDIRRSFDVQCINRIWPEGIQASLQLATA